MAAADEAAQDLYGFPLPPGAAVEAAVGAPRGGRELPPEPELKELVRGGVPPPLRGWVWTEASGAAARRAAQSPSYFAGMAAAGQAAAAPHAAAIAADARCAFPAHPWLRSDEGQAALRRVCAAFAAHNPRVGYTRPLSQIVALLLVALNRNQARWENAFWLLVQLVEATLLEGTYSQNLAGCAVEMRALEALIAAKLPRLAAHMAALEADVSLFAMDWFLSLFAASLPSETAARVWDALLLEGPKILFRVALALLKSNEDALLSNGSAGELTLAARAAAAGAHDRDALMRVAFEGVGGLPMAVIERARGQGSREVEAEARERDAARSGSAGGAVSPRHVPQQHSGELRELRERAGVLTAVAASGVRKGVGALVSAARKAAGGGPDKRAGGEGAVPGALAP
ncbi:hypothetical protein Rsub_09102 [Raphidocelis subcapitata]|uniref:Rab-GAP TBC domain-containing protein n=1 Tax=Raphidocelis subcapitata TaxID=307507 RepID=A0A2V0PGH6_9CHLO|nr:hypothetical protein Rsub_09102 [Raphidocelis subcapitata]|eukprot:GBF96307.1 hypothetical protein Rsub_09102 [Raphidocelis subcapitata]